MGEEMKRSDRMQATISEWLVAMRDTIFDEPSQTEEAVKQLVAGLERQIDGPLFTFRLVHANGTGDVVDTWHRNTAMLQLPDEITHYIDAHPGEYQIERGTIVKELKFVCVLKVRSEHEHDWKMHG